MAKRESAVGIKELKDQASAIVEQVARTGRSVVITKNNREVARIVAIRPDLDQRLLDLGLMATLPRLDLASVKLIPLGIDPAEAIAAIRADRDDE